MRVTVLVISDFLFAKSRGRAWSVTLLFFVCGWDEVGHLSVDEVTQFYFCVLCRAQFLRYLWNSRSMEIKESFLLISSAATVAAQSVMQLLLFLLLDLFHSLSIFFFFFPGFLVGCVGSVIPTYSIALYWIERVGGILDLSIMKNCSFSFLLKANKKNNFKSSFQSCLG